MSTTEPATSKPRATAHSFQSQTKAGPGGRPPKGQRMGLPWLEREGLTQHNGLTQSFNKHPLRWLTDPPRRCCPSAATVHADRWAGVRPRVVRALQGSSGEQS